MNTVIHQNEIARLYNNIAWYYDAWAYLTETKAQKKAIELADIHDRSTILEVAVGTGKNFNELLKRNPNGSNIGIDISKGMLAKAKSRLSKQSNRNYSLEIGSAFDIKMDDHSVDTLINNYMFDLIPFGQMDSIIDEFSRILKPGGKLVLVNMTKGERYGSGLYERIYQISPSLMGECRGVQQRGLISQHGFQIITREYVQQMLFPSEVILATK